MINESIFNSANLLGKSGTLSERSITVAFISRLAAYWPPLTYQHAANGAIWEVRYNCSTGTADCWDNKPLNIGGLDAGLDWQKSRTAEISVGFFFSTSGMAISSLITRGVVKQIIGPFVRA